MYKGEMRHFKDVAKFLKESFDETYSGTWNVVVGKLLFY